MYFVGTYVLVITSRKEVGNYLGFPVFRVTSMKFLSCNEASRNLTNQEVWLCNFHLINISKNLTVWLITLQQVHLSTEKGWRLLYDPVKDGWINSWLVLFLWNRYNTEVSFCISISLSIVYIEISFIDLFSRLLMHLPACSGDASWQKDGRVNPFGSRYLELTTIFLFGLFMIHIWYNVENRIHK